MNRTSLTPLESETVTATSSGATLTSPTAGRVFVYLNSAFTPRYDEKVANLYAWHGVEGKLVVNYALQQAWG